MVKKMTRGQIFVLTIREMNERELVIALAILAREMRTRGLEDTLTSVLTRTKTLIEPSEIDNAFLLYTKVNSRGRKPERIEKVWHLFVNSGYDKISISDIVEVLPGVKKEPLKAASSLISRINRLWKANGVNLYIFSKKERNNNNWTTIYWIGRPVNPR